MTDIKCSASVEAEPGETITVRAVYDFLHGLPPQATDCEVWTITGDKGSQRDPWPYLRGVRVEWTESR